MVRSSVHLSTVLCALLLRWVLSSVTLAAHVSQRLARDGGAGLRALGCCPGPHKGLATRCCCIQVRG